MPGTPRTDRRPVAVGVTTVLLTVIVLAAIVAVIAALYGVAVRGAPEDK